MPATPQIPDWLQALYPFTPKRLEVGGARLSYVDAGPAEGDEAVLMLHGNPTWSFYYRALIQAASPRLRCIAPDHVGCGLSDKPQNYPYTLAQHIANVERLAEALRLRRVHLVVHDWGGAIGFGWAARHPERVGKIVILNTAAFPASRLPWRIRACRAPWLGELLVRGLNGFAAPATWMAVQRPLRPEVKRGYLFPYDSWAHRVAVHRFVRDIPLRADHPSMAALQAAAAGLPQFAAHPLLIAWGGRDFCFNDYFYRRWREIYPAAGAHRFEHAGHYVLEDAAAEIIPLIRDFLLA
jgi:haloalkane dehalogenase